MATLNAQSFAFSSLSSSNQHRVFATLIVPANVSTTVAKGLPKLQNITQNGAKNIISFIMSPINTPVESNSMHVTSSCNNDEQELLVQKIYAILEAIADRAEMHAIIGEQRDNWNHLLTNSINCITITASLMAGISLMAVISGATPSFIAFKLSSVLLFTVATGMMMAVNKIQPSQLAEEQRNSTRLWKQLEKSIETMLALRTPTEQDIQEAMDKVHALDKAYPLPLLPGMLEKFPKIVEPAQWWPKNIQNRKQIETANNRVSNNGWSKELEDEIQGVLRVLKVKDEQEYLNAGKVALKINKTLATAGPIFAGLAAIGSGLIGIGPALGPLPALLGVVGGSFAALSNTLEHCGQLGMLFELFRNCAGHYRRLEDEIELNLSENDVNKRENGELFEVKMALQLGRSLSELKGLSCYASNSCKDDIKEFAGKLF